MRIFLTAAVFVPLLRQAGVVCTNTLRLWSSCYFFNMPKAVSLSGTPIALPAFVSSGFIHAMRFSRSACNHSGSVTLERRTPVVIANMTAEKK